MTKTQPPTRMLQAAFLAANRCAVGLLTRRIREGDGGPLTRGGAAGQETRRASCVVVLLALVLAAPLAGAAAEGLRTSLGPEGPASISYGGHELLAPKSPPEAEAATAGGTPVRFAKPPVCTLKDGTWTQTWDGLEIVTRLRQDKDVLALDVTLRNTGTQPLARIDYRPLALHFPRRPQGGRWFWGYEVSVDTEESPGVLVADWGEDKLALCVERGSPKPAAEDAARPMTIGFRGNYGPFDAAVKTPVFFRTTFNPPLDPGKPWTFRASLRLASAATPMEKVAGDSYAGFAKALPFALAWPDRRPIGASSWPATTRSGRRTRAATLTTRRSTSFPTRGGRPSANASSSSPTGALPRSRRPAARA